MSDDTMTALVLEEFGAELVRRSLPRPVPTSGQALVRVAASGVNPLDVKISAGTAGHAQVAVPAVLGMDLAGVVAAVGADVARFAVGDEVYGMTGGIGALQGSLAEYVAVDADLLAIKPANLTMVQAAALPLSVITAWEGLVDRAQVQAGQTVLVHGGAGGVGHIAVQLAVARGARVFATAGARDADLVQSFGAVPIDYASTTVEDYIRRHTGGQGFDVIFDTLGGTTLDDSFAAVRTYTGHVVSILGWGAHNLAPLSFRGATYSGVFTLLPILTGVGREHHGEILTQAATLADAGGLTPRVHHEPFGFASIAQAHRLVGEGAARGKVVVTVDPPTRD